jgi:hypothetical protein
MVREMHRCRSAIDAFHVPNALRIGKVFAKEVPLGKQDPTCRTY